MGLPVDAALSNLAMVFAPQPGNEEGSELVAIRESDLAHGTVAIQGEAAGVTEDDLTLFYEVADGVYGLVALLSSPADAPMRWLSLSC